MTDFPAVPVLDVWVPGKPEPQGSVTAFVPERNGQVIRKNGRVVVNLTSDNPALKKWRKLASTCASAALARDAGTALPPAPVDKPAAFVLHATFALLRPETSHYRTGRNTHLVRDAAPAWPTTIPDVDKLLRATLDSLTGVLYVDDSQVIDVIVSKRYAVPTVHGDGVGVRVKVGRIEIERADGLPEHMRRRPNYDEQAARETQRALFDGAAL